MDTELTLHHWRLGQTIAERMCAGILRVSGYIDVEPQAPLGGPDGKKDIIVQRDDKRYVAAVYFPSTPSTFAEIAKKYEADLEGVEANDADGFIFLTNQHISVGERAKLLALRDAKTDQIFNVERLRAVLDEPRGYGLRLEYLHISMSREEQVAFFNTWEQDAIQRILKSELQDDQLASKLPATARIDISLLKMLHAAMFQNLVMHTEIELRNPRPWVAGGRFRRTELHIMGQDGCLLRVATPPAEIMDALTRLFEKWRNAYTQAIAADREEILRILAWFHHGLVSIMPFSDGNGRLARVIINQAAQELCHMGVDVDLTADRPAYYAALQAADKGDFSVLVELVRAALV